ncbi:MAG: DUF3775 domain-containing protein [Thermaurantiacus sp.]
MAVPPETVGIPIDTLAAIILHARAWDAQSGSGERSSSNASDDGFAAMFSGGRANPVASELANEIDGLSAEEQAALVALAWVGRGDFDAADWDEAVATALDRATGPTARYLMEMPLVGDYLEEGASALGIAIADEEADILYGRGRGEA